MGETSEQETEEPEKHALSDEDIDEIIREQLDDMDEIVDELIREKKAEVIQEKVQEELARILHQTSEQNGSSVAS